MKRLNLPALIMLNMRIIIILIPFSPVAGVLFSFFIKAETVLPIIIGTAAAFLLPLSVLFFFRCYPKKHERELIEGADLPLWNKLSEEDKQSLCSEKPMSLTTALKWTAVILVLSLMFLYFARNDSTVFIIVIICMLLAMLAVLFSFCGSNLWADIDDTAVYTDIPVHHSFTKKYSGGKRLPYYVKSYSEFYEKQLNNKNAEHYAVCYLPDGKYIFYNDSGINHPAAIRIIKYKGQYKTIIKK